MVTAAELIDDTLIFQNVPFSNGDHFTLAVPAIPSIGVNNSLWLRADKGLTLSGNQVSGWADQSGLNNNASQGTAGSRPTLVENTINGNHAIAFDGKTVEGTRGFYTREYFVMADPDITYSSSSSPGYLLGYETGQVSGLALGNSVNTWTNEVITHLYRTNQHITVRGGSSFRNPTIMNSRNNNGGTSQTLFTNGSSQTVSPTGTVTNRDNRPYRLGNNFNNSGAFNGKIGEVLSFSTTQTPAEKRNIESYLALKYGITLDPAGGNYTLGGTVVYNVSTYSGFTNNVIGIISYAKYDFLQTSSSSINNGSVLKISNASTLDNNDMIVIGDDGGAMSSNSAGIPAEVGERVVRKWATQTTNTPGAITLSFDLNGLGYSTKTANDFSLILDTNSNFADGISRLLTPTSWDGQVVTFTNVDLNGINYFGLGTSIDLVSDSDLDGIPDYFEVAYGTDPHNGNSPVIGGSPFTDINSELGINNDGISDALEKILIDNGATGPVTRYTDTDGDGIPDWIEVKLGTNPYNSNSPTSNGHLDSDGEGLPDALELLISQKGGSTNASFTTDTDNDGVPDFLEIVNNTDPGNANHPSNLGGLDSDGDGVSNAMEATIIAGGATGPVNKESDTDGDGIPDYIEAITYTDPFNILGPSVPASLVIRTSNADFSVSGSSCIDISGHQWINVLDPSGRLIFSINPVGNNLGSTCYGVRILNGISAIRTNGSDYFLNRNWWITPANQPTGEKAYIRFYAQGIEMLGLWGKAVDVGIITEDVNEADFNKDYVRVTKYANSSPLDPLIETGEKTIMTANLLPFGTNNRIFTIGTGSFSSFNVHTSTNNPLPITLLYFEGQAVEHAVELHWATSSETDHDGFEVERSINGKDFQTIGRVKSAGNSITKQDYYFSDAFPPSGMVYYRLKSVDIDGAIDYSKIINFTIQGIEESIIAYPNPTNDVLYLKFMDDLAGETPTLSLLDMNGKRHKVQIAQITHDHFSVQLRHFSSGSYFLEIRYGANSIVKHIIKN